MGYFCGQLIGSLETSQNAVLSCEFIYYIHMCQCAMIYINVYVYVYVCEPSTIT